MGGVALATIAHGLLDWIADFDFPNSADGFLLVLLVLFASAVVIVQGLASVAGILGGVLRSSVWLVFVGFIAVVLFGAG